MLPVGNSTSVDMNLLSKDFSKKLPLTKIILAHVEILNTQIIMLTVITRILL